MKVIELKARYNMSLNLFCYSAIITNLFLIFALFTEHNSWLICFVPTVLLFSIIGLGYAIRGLIFLTEKEGTESEMTKDDYFERLYGMDGFKATFIVLSIIIAACSLAVYLTYFPIETIKTEFSWLGFVLLLITIYLDLKVSRELSFVIMSVTIIKSMKTKKGDSDESNK